MSRRSCLLSVDVEGYQPRYAEAGSMPLWTGLQTFLLLLNLPLLHRNLPSTQRSTPPIWPEQGALAAMALDEKKVVARKVATTKTDNVFAFIELKRSSYFLSIEMSYLTSVGL